MVVRVEEKCKKKLKRGKTQKKDLRVGFVGCWRIANEKFKNHRLYR
jgi:hypothetical protein